MPQSTRWISRQLSELLAWPAESAAEPEAASGPARNQDDAIEKRRRCPRAPIDVLIIGSGYGAAMAAATFAGCKNEDGNEVSVVVLERGLEYLPGSFPARVTDMPRRVRGHFAGRDIRGEQLYDLRLGSDVSVVLANGLGGGSLINAGVMERPHPDVFGNERWPEALGGGQALAPYYVRASDLLGATVNGAPNTIASHPHLPGQPDGSTALSKTQRLQDLARGANASSGPGATPVLAEPAPITVAMTRRQTAAGVELEPCLLCGDCATGCNYGAKESLDTNLLVQAHLQGAEIYCGATALRLECRKLREEDAEPVWSVEVVHTDEKLRRREGDSTWIDAHRVILAAGSLGSTEILLRSQAQSLRWPLAFSSQLGRRFSTNGDMIHFGYAYNSRVNAFADQDQPPDQQNVGPTITGLIRTTINGRPATVEEMAVPGAIRWLAQEMVTTANSLYWLASVDKTVHGNSHPQDDVIAVQPDKIAHTAVWAVMGDDGANGTLTLPDPKRVTLYDGHVRVQWPEAKTWASPGQLFFEENEWIGRAASQCESLKGQAIPNPVWQSLPPGKGLFLRDQQGPLLTVHPLGGCAMADSIDQGVVNEWGQVFHPRPDGGLESERQRARKPDKAWELDKEGRAVYTGLVVLDGAIVPSALCINPALTIAALSLRAAEELRNQWRWTPKRFVKPSAGLIRPVVANGIPTSENPEPLPTVADVVRETEARQTQTPTMAEFMERLSGPVTLLDDDGIERKCVAELTLTYEPIELRKLHTPPPGGRGALLDATLKVAPSTHVEGGKDGPKDLNRRLRVFRECDWNRVRRRNLSFAEREQELEALALMEFELGDDSTLTILQREATTACQRQRRALYAWALNRGVRDFLPMLGPRNLIKLTRSFIQARRQLRVAGETRLPSDWCQVLRRVLPAADGDGTPAERGRKFIASIRELASHAGEVRRFVYKLEIARLKSLRQQPVGQFDWPSFSHKGLQPGLKSPLVGIKRITYRRPSNPWRQLQELTLDQNGPLPLAPGSPRVLTLDNNFLVDRGVPLMRIISQPDHMTALLDVAALGLVFARMLLPIHDWNLRKPDIPRQRRVQRLPDLLYGLPRPDKYEVVVDEYQGQAVLIRLTRYRLKDYDRSLAPVLLIHGYSASGTTYAHPSLKPSLVQSLAARGRDVWVVDLRTSAGLPTAIIPWTFEQVAMADIPVAVDFVCQATRQPKVDVVAHCMGSAMFSMAVLSASLNAREIVGERDDDDKLRDRFKGERRALPSRIGKAILSQVGPLLVLSPQNMFRAFVQQFVTQLFGNLPYDFRPKPDDGLGMELLDRLFSSMQYSDAELRSENHWNLFRRTDFAGPRHRMDALYGKTFELSNMSSEVLDRIDDFFGPLNLATVAQVGHFARRQSITNRDGRNRFVNLKNIEEHWQFPTLYLHATLNGLSDIATLDRMERVFAEAGQPIQVQRLCGMGHQDSLIGKQCEITFQHIRDFLG